MKNRLLILPSMVFLFALVVAFYLTAPTVHADDLATSPSLTSEAQATNLGTSTTSQTSSAELSELAQQEQVSENSSETVRLESSAQQGSVNSDSSTEMQDPAEQTPPIEEVTSLNEEGDSTDTENSSGVIRATSAQTVHTRSIISSEVGNAITDLSTDKASYRPDEPVNLSVDFKNTTDTEQDITVHADVYYLENKIGAYQFTKHLAAGESYQMQSGDLVIPASQFSNDHAYLIKVSVVDSKDQTIGQINRAVAYESDWTKFPRYGIVGGSQDKHNSLLSEDVAEKYRPALEKMKNMNINSYFFYDVYKSATNPFPNEVSFDQTWNTWSHSKIDTQAVKDIVNQVHDGGAVAMLYNMILAEQANEAPVLPETEYAYNSDNRGYGEKGQPMSYFIDGKPLQRYYNPRSKQWQDFIASRMEEAMKNGGFDGWQGDTIGDNQVYSYADKDSNDDSKRFWLTEGYAEFLNAIKEKLPNYYLTLNDVNGEQIYRLGSAKQDVIYNEIWPFGGSALGNGRQQTEYGDLKARVDEVRKVTGKSLIVGAYMEEGNTDDKGHPNGAKQDAQAGGEFQKDAVLLTTATIAAAGGYHMSLAAIGNDKDSDNIGVLQTAYYPTQDLKVSSELNRKNNDYQQFITAYENILRDHVENDDAIVKTYDAQGNLLSTDNSGINGHQVWTFGKKGADFRTVQLLNLMGINSDWKNEAGSSANKTPDEQTNLTVTYALSNVSMEDANRMANQTYVVSPDDWSKSNMLKVSARVETDENGNPVLVMTVPKLTLWDVIYISNANNKSDVEPTKQEEASRGESGTPTENNPSQEASQDTPAEPANQEDTPAGESETPVQPEPEVTDTPVADTTPTTPIVEEPSHDSTTATPQPANPAEEAQPDTPTSQEENSGNTSEAPVPSSETPSEEVVPNDDVPTSTEEGSVQPNVPVDSTPVTPDAGSGNISETPVDEDAPNAGTPVVPEASVHPSTPTEETSDTPDSDSGSSPDAPAPSAPTEEVTPSDETPIAPEPNADSDTPTPSQDEPTQPTEDDPPKVQPSQGESEENPQPSESQPTDKPADNPPTGDPVTPDVDEPGQADNNEKDETTSPTDVPEEEGTDNTTDSDLVEVLPLPSDVLPTPESGTDSPSVEPKKSSEAASKKVTTPDTAEEAGTSAKSAREDTSDSTEKTSNPMISSHTGQPMSPQLPAGADSKLVASGKKALSKQTDKKNSAKQTPVTLGLVAALGGAAAVGFGFIVAKRKKSA